jgi:hypothetical protein
VDVFQLDYEIERGKRYAIMAECIAANMIAVYWGAHGGMVDDVPVSQIIDNSETLAARYINLKYPHD